MEALISIYDYGRHWEWERQTLVATTVIAGVGELQVEFKQQHDFQAVQNVPPPPPPASYRVLPDGAKTVGSRLPE